MINQSDHGVMYYVSNSKTSWTKVCLSVPIAKVFCGSLSSIALSVDDKVFVQGDNGSRELGLNRDQIAEWEMNEELSGIGMREIGIFTYQTIFITWTNQVFVAGSNNSDQLGIRNSAVLQRHTTLESYCNKHLHMIPHITGGFQHMIVYFTVGKLFLIDCDA